MTLSSFFWLNPWSIRILPLSSFCHHQLNYKHNVCITNESQDSRGRIFPLFNLYILFIHVWYSLFCLCISVECICRCINNSIQVRECPFSFLMKFSNLTQYFLFSFHQHHPLFSVCSWKLYNHLFNYCLLPFSYSFICSFSYKFNERWIVFIGLFC